jgi:hypothetical protein
MNSRKARSRQERWLELRNSNAPHLSITLYKSLADATSAPALGVFQTVPKHCVVFLRKGPHLNEF